MKVVSLAKLLALPILLCDVPAAHTVHAASDAPPRISVVFVKPDSFTDVGYVEGERGERAILLELQRFIVDTASRYVPKPTRLEIKITDIDLAGDFELFRGPHFDHVRVNKSIYPPRIALEFRVTGSDDQTTKEGVCTLTDPDYQLRVVYPREDYLRHEKELLRDWLRGEFATLKSAKAK